MTTCCISDACQLVVPTPVVNYTSFIELILFYICHRNIADEEQCSCTWHLLIVSMELS